MRQHKYIDNHKYLLVILVVRERYEDGCPKDLTLVKPETLVKLAQDEPNEFITAYIREDMMPRSPNI
jgi:hypothetical protein